MFRGEGRRGKQGGQVNDTASFCDILHRIATIAATHTHTHNHPPATKRMDQLYVGTSNTLFTDAESAEAVRLYNQLPTDWFANRRHEHVAKQMTYDTRNVHRKQIARALERHTSSGGITAMCRRQLKRKVRAIAPQKKRKSRRAVPLNTKVGVFIPHKPIRSSLHRIRGNPKNHVSEPNKHTVDVASLTRRESALASSWPTSLFNAPQSGCGRLRGTDSHTDGRERTPYCRPAIARGM